MTTLAYRPEIDGLRAIAVAAVVLYHVEPLWLPGGFVGVDVFFVISGYLITRLLAVEWDRDRRIDFAAFYARRVRRLLPALLLVVVAAMAIALWVLGRSPVLLQQTAESGIASLLFFANIHFQVVTGGYFDPAADSQPLLHLWSLAVEEQFYLVYPLLLALLMRGGVPAARRRLLLLALVSLLLAEYWANIRPELAFFQMPARFWELAAGGCVALSVAGTAPGVAARLALPVGLVLVLLASIATPQWGPFPGKSALPAVVGSVLVLWALHRGVASGPWAWLLRSRPFVGLGLLSYSLYLWHWPLLVIDSQSRMETATAAWRLGIAMLAVGLAALTWRFVEQPLRKGLLRHPLRVIALGLAATALSAGLLAAMARIDRVPPDAARIAAAAREDVPAYRRDCHFDVHDAITALKPSRCHSQPGVTPRFVLWGDSHAMAWQPFAWRIAGDAGLSAQGITMNSCPPAIAPAKGTPCETLNMLALESLAQSPPGVLLLAQRWPYASSDAAPALQVRMANLEAVLAIAPAAAQVLVLGPLPRLDWPGPDCITRGWEADCGPTRAEHEAAFAGTWSALEAMARRDARVTLVDPAPFFCGSGRCEARRGDLGLYWDRDHITAGAAAAFADAYSADPARYTRRVSPPAEESP